MVVDVSIPIHLAKSHELKLRIKLYKIENIHSVVESAQMSLSNSWNIPQNTPHSRTQMHYIQIHKTSFFFRQKYILVVFFPLLKHILEPSHLPTQPTSCCSFPLLSEREKKRKN